MKHAPTVFMALALVCAVFAFGGWTLGVSPAFKVLYFACLIFAGACMCANLSRIDRQ